MSRAVSQSPASVVSHDGASSGVMLVATPPFPLPPPPPSPIAAHDEEIQSGMEACDYEQHRIDHELDIFLQQDNEKWEEQDEAAATEPEAAATEPEDEGAVTEPEDEGAVTEAEDEGAATEPEDEGAVTEAEDEAAATEPEEGMESVTEEFSDRWWRRNHREQQIIARYIAEGVSSFPFECGEWSSDDEL